MNSFFRNARVYKLTPGAGAILIQPTVCKATLDPWRFKEGGALEMQSIGWMPPRDDSDDLAHIVGGQILLRLRVQKKLLPAAVVKQEAKRRAADIEEQQGYKPGRKQMKEIAETVTDELLPKAFSKYTDTGVWIDPANGFLVIDSASASKSDEVLGMLAKAFDPFPVQALYMQTMPALAMTTWLADDEAPAGFTIDQDAELESMTASGAKVRYVRQSIDPAEVNKHIGSGKQCTRLALTWNDRVSFVLAEDFTLKSIKPLDVLRENGGAEQNEADQLDSDFTLMAGELGKLLCDLIAAHGGEREPT